MATANITGAQSGSPLGTPLTQLLLSDDIEPGSALGYQTAKTIYAYHPLGAKMVDKPILIAQSQERVLGGAPDPVLAAFVREWKNLLADGHIKNAMSLARIYGVSTVAYGIRGFPTNRPIPPDKLVGADIYFNVLDPLNTAGSLVLNQDPNAPDFLKPRAVSIAGKPYHGSRVCVMFNEDPIYIEYTTSAFGYVGRSVYQRPLYPLKSFVQSMKTDDMVTRKAGLLIAKMKSAVSIIDQIMLKAAAFKRELLKIGVTDNVLSIDITEEIETLNMMNIDGAGKFARDNILHNIAAAAGMPAMMINDETFAEGFGEGTEDAKEVAQFIGDMRTQMQPLYDFFTRICQYRAWSEEFFATLQAEFPDQFGGVEYATAFFQWVNGFTADWPNLLIEPDSERAKSEKVILDAIVEVTQTLLPTLDPENKATLVQWMADNLNEKKLLFTVPLVLDYEALATYEPPVPVAAGGGEKEPPA